MRSKISTGYRWRFKQKGRGNDIIQSQSKMTIETGNDPQEYHVEIWYKKPELYRVYLENPKKDQSQVILRNGNGVFVLTPSLNKSFRFHSDWPNNSSQVYLFESLVKDIKMTVQLSSKQKSRSTFLKQNQLSAQPNAADPRDYLS